MIVEPNKKLKIVKDEWYPVYSFYPAQEGDKHVVTIAPDRVKEWERVFERFNALQDKLENIYLSQESGYADK